MAWRPNDTGLSRGSGIRRGQATLEFFGGSPFQSSDLQGLDIHAGLSFHGG